MKRVNFKRSVNFLLISISLIVTGCSDTPKEPLSINEQAPVKSIRNDSYVYHPYRTLHKHKFKTASTHKNTVWERLLSLYSLPDIKNPRIDRELYWYLEHPASLAILQQRAEPYLHHILDEIEAKNIPGELALLPVVESAFVPDAYSKADASGLWQFVPATGKEYGLQQNDWYDGRRDVYASTKAATTYLKELSENFDGDWLLALASYNCGKGRVKKSI
ncbi:MAG: transglycosylase SLT domain-containing protein, partial [Methylococcaceae bacterium]|nr:transglycosylase SLT domain-containing protein [Methylococcaceae bacterium]